MTKSRIAAMAAMALAAACLATAASAQDKGSGPTGDWAFVKAVSIGCKHTISGLDNTMELGLALANARGQGVELTKANFAGMLHAPKVQVLSQLPERMAGMDFSKTGCAGAIAAMELKVEALTAGIAPPLLPQD